MIIQRQNRFNLCLKHSQQEPGGRYETLQSYRIQRKPAAVLLKHAQLKTALQFVSYHALSVIHDRRREHRVPNLMQLLNFVS